MNYISAERFLSQDEKVQKTLLDWWRPSKGDIYYDIDGYGVEWTGLIVNDADLKVIETDKRYNYYLPKLNEFQLRNFIQDNGYKYIGINNFIELDNKETWNIKAFKGMMQLEPDFEFVSSNPLECYWYIVLKIIEDIPIIKSNHYEECKSLFGEMRNLTKEERDALYKGLDEISEDTGIKLFDYVDDKDKI